MPKMDDGARFSVLATETVPLADLHPYPGNPRQSDLSLIRESVRKHGVYRAMVANRRTKEVLAGNHLMAALLEEGFTHALVHWVDVDEEEAARIVLVDNRASDLGGYDSAALVSLLGTLPSLEGTGYKPADLDLLLSELEPNFAPVGADEQSVLDRLAMVKCPECGHEFRPKT